MCTSSSVALAAIIPGAQSSPTAAAPRPHHLVAVKARAASSETAASAVTAVAALRRCRRLLCWSMPVGAVSSGAPSVGLSRRCCDRCRCRCRCSLTSCPSTRACAADRRERVRASKRCRAWASWAAELCAGVGAAGVSGIGAAGVGTCCGGCCRATSKKGLNVACGVGHGVGGAVGAAVGAAVGLAVGLAVTGATQPGAPGMPSVDWPTAHVLQAAAPLQYVPTAHGGAKRPAAHGGQ